MKAELKAVDPQELERFVQTLKDELPEVPMDRFERAVSRALVRDAGCQVRVLSDGKNNVWLGKAT